MVAPARYLLQLAQVGVVNTTMALLAIDDIDIVPDLSDRTNFTKSSLVNLPAGQLPVSSPSVERTSHRRDQTQLSSDTVPLQYGITPSNG